VKTKPFFCVTVSQVFSFLCFFSGFFWLVFPPPHFFCFDGVQVDVRRIASFFYQKRRVWRSKTATSNCECECVWFWLEVMRGRSNGEAQLKKVDFDHMCLCIKAFLLSWNFPLLSLSSQSIKSSVAVWVLMGVCGTKKLSYEKNKVSFYLQPLFFGSYKIMRKARLYLLNIPLLNMLGICNLIFVSIIRKGKKECSYCRLYLTEKGSLRL